MQKRPHAHGFSGQALALGAIMETCSILATISYLAIALEKIL